MDYNNTCAYLYSDSAARFFWCVCNHALEAHHLPHLEPLSLLHKNTHTHTQSRNISHSVLPLPTLTVPLEQSCIDHVFWHYLMHLSGTTERWCNKNIHPPPSASQLSASLPPAFVCSVVLCHDSGCRGRRKKISRMGIYSHANNATILYHGLPVVHYPTAPVTPLWTQAQWLPYNKDYIKEGVLRSRRPALLTSKEWLNKATPKTQTEAKPKKSCQNRIYIRLWIV